MSLPAANEPAFIRSSLGEETASSFKCPPTSFLASSPESRSTSTGSLSPLPSMPEGEVDCGGLPDFEYPVPFIVRNTFIDAGIVRPISLDEFFEERRVHSCPVESPPGLRSEIEVLEGLPLASGTMPSTITPGISVMDSALAAAASASAAMAAAARCWMQPLMQGPESGTPGTIAYGAQVPSSPKPGTVTLRLADALEEPELGSPELPTVGSTGHRMGNCKPCAFYHSKGCGNSTQCPFCHLCPAGEKKRRQKEKGAVEREMRRMGFASGV